MKAPTKKIMLWSAKFRNPGSPLKNRIKWTVISLIFLI